MYTKHQSELGLVSCIYSQVMRDSKTFKQEQQKQTAFIRQILHQTSIIKINKIVQKIKQTNQPFRQFCQINHIKSIDNSTLKKFQFFLLKNMLQKNSPKTKSTKSIKNYKLICQGFKSIVDQLYDIKTTSFIKQIKYLREDLSRQNQNFNRLNYQYIGGTNKHEFPNCLANQMHAQQKIFGEFQLINQNTRNQIKAIEDIEEYFRSLIAH